LRTTGVGIVRDKVDEDPVERSLLFIEKEGAETHINPSSTKVMTESMKGKRSAMTGYFTVSGPDRAMGSEHTKPFLVLVDLGGEGEHHDIYEEEEH
jgi:hypothetical protein